MADRFRRLGAELIQVEKKDSGLNTVICPACAKNTLLKLDTKYYCIGECDRIFDAFPDGDGPLEC